MCVVESFNFVRSSSRTENLMSESSVNGTQLKWEKQKKKGKNENDKRENEAHQMCLKRINAGNISH